MLPGAAPMTSFLECQNNDKTDVPVSVSASFTIQELSKKYITDVYLMKVEFNTRNKEDEVIYKCYKKYFLYRHIFIPNQAIACKVLHKSLNYKLHNINV